MYWKLARSSRLAKIAMCHTVQNDWSSQSRSTEPLHYKTASDTSRDAIVPVSCCVPAVLLLQEMILY